MRRAREVGSPRNHEGWVMFQRGEQQVLALHQVIEEWLAGRVAKSRASFAPFVEALHEAFELISPSGERSSKDDITTELWDAHGCEERDFRIDIRNYRLRTASDDWVVATYEEWQLGASERGRISTVTFLRGERGELQWWHLHETWLGADRGRD